MIEYAGVGTRHGGMPKRSVAKCKLRHPFDRDTKDEPTRAASAADVLELH